MAKKKIKTSQYFTRTCANCGFEMANWFVQCPRCHHVWNSPDEETPQTENVPSEEKIAPKKKMIRIIAQLTEEDVKIKIMSIYFSSDNGISWFSMPMSRENDSFVAEIEDVPNDATVIYYLKGVDENGVEFTEDNNSEYYYYYVGEENKEQQQKNESNIPNAPPEPLPQDISSEPMSQNSPDIPDSLNKNPKEIKDIPVPIAAPDQFHPSIENKQIDGKIQDNTSSQKKSDSNFVFTPLSKIKEDTNLKICPNCKSKIKKDWAVCPICGASQRIIS